MGTSGGALSATASSFHQQMQLPQASPPDPSPPTPCHTQAQAQASPPGPAPCSAYEAQAGRVLSRGLRALPPSLHPPLLQLQLLTSALLGEKDPSRLQNTHVRAMEVRGPGWVIGQGGGRAAQGGMP